MDEYTLPHEEEDLLDLNEVKQAFGVSAWKKMAAIVMPSAGFFNRQAFPFHPYGLLHRENPA